MSESSSAYLGLAARAAEVLLVHTVQGVDGRMEEGPGWGRITVIGLVADPPGFWQREVGADRRDPVGAAACVYKKKSLWN